MTSPQPVVHDDLEESEGVVATFRPRPRRRTLTLGVLAAHATVVALFAMAPDKVGIGYRVVELVAFVLAIGGFILLRRGDRLAGRRDRSAARRAPDLGA